MNKEQQRAKTRARVKRYRDRAKSVTDVTVTPEDVTLECNGVVTPEGVKPEVPANYGQPNCECRHCAQTKTQRERGQIVLNHGAYKPEHELADNEVNRVSLPGDVDYAGVCLGKNMTVIGR